MALDQTLENDTPDIKLHIMEGEKQADEEWLTAVL